MKEKVNIVLETYSNSYYSLRKLMLKVPKEFRKNAIVISDDYGTRIEYSRLETDEEYEYRFMKERNKKAEQIFQARKLIESINP